MATGCLLFSLSNFERFQHLLLKCDAMVGVGVIGIHMDRCDLGIARLTKVSGQFLCRPCIPSLEVRMNTGRVARRGASSGRFHALA